MYSIYVLRSLETKDEYVGMSQNPHKRLEDHNHGRVKSTRSKRPWEIVHVECFDSRVEARIREKYFKSAAGRRLRKKLRAVSSVG